MSSYPVLNNMRVVHGIEKDVHTCLRCCITVLLDTARDGVDQVLRRADAGDGGGSGAFVAGGVLDEVGDALGL